MYYRFLTFIIQIITVVMEFLTLWVSHLLNYSISTDLFEIFHHQLAFFLIFLIFNVILKSNML